MTIDWQAFVTVFFAALTGAALCVSLYALGIRFLATRSTRSQSGPERDDEYDDIEAGVRPSWASALAWTFFVLSGLTALVGVILIVPALHFWS